MITFDDWKIQSVGYPLAMQYDHMTREMYISGDIPDGYTWDVLCRYKRELNIIRLEVVEGGISTLFTKHDLANSGTYIIQLRGTKDGTVRHSNAIQVEVPKSLSADDQGRRSNPDQRARPVGGRDHDQCRYGGVYADKRRCCHILRL